MSGATLDVLLSVESLVGIVVGSLVLLAALAWATIKKRPLPFGGLLLTGSILIALALTNELSAVFIVGLVLLAVAGWLPTRSLATIMLTLIPGAAAVAVSLANRPETVVESIAVVAIVVAGPLVASFDERYQTSAIATPLMAISFLGVFATVPDTDKAIIAAAAATPWLIAGPPLRLAHLGRAGAFASSGALVWVIASGGFSRTEALIAGLATLGILLAEPVIRMVRSVASTRIDRLLERDLLGAAAILGVQAGIGLTMGQLIGGARLGVWPTTVIATLLIILIGIWATSPKPDR